MTVQTMTRELHPSVWSIADSGSFPGVIGHSLSNNDFREPCETLRLNSGHKQVTRVKERVILNGWGLTVEMIYVQ